MNSLKIILLMLLLAIAMHLTACARVTGGSRITFSASPKFLIAGQSNGVSPAQLHMPYWSQTGLVTVTDVYGGRIQRVPTQTNPIDSSITWIYLGDRINRTVEFVNIALGNQSTQKWSDTHFDSMMKPAIEASDFDAVLWVQGESDIAEFIPEETTYSNMKSLITRSREIRPGLVWFVALDSDITGRYKGTNSVRRSQQRIINEGLAQQGPDLDQLREHRENCETSFVEFVGVGLRAHADLWFQVLQPHL